MKLEDICVSLDLAKHLKEAGYPQESLFIWYKPKESKRDFELTPKGYQIHPKEGKNDCIDWFASPTASEIGEKLPNLIGDYKLWCTKDGCMYEDQWGNVKFSELGVTEADARASCWLWLKKQGLLPTQSKEGGER